MFEIGVDCLEKRYVRVLFSTVQVGEIDKSGQVSFQ